MTKLHVDEIHVRGVLTCDEMLKADMMCNACALWREREGDLKGAWGVRVEGYSSPEAGAAPLPVEGIGSASGVGEGEG